MPLVVTLTPLHRLDSKAFKLVRTISDRLIDRTIKLLQYLWDLQNDCEYVKSHRVVQKYFPRFKKVIQKFETPLNEFIDNAEAIIRKILPR